MGDHDGPDCSWKKLVIAKANDHWISTIKTEPDDTISSTQTTDLSLNCKKITNKNIKSENEDTSDNEIIEIKEQAFNQTDPLLLEVEVEVSNRKRRKSSLGLKNETPEERSFRLSKMSAYAAQRIANETPEQRATRLKRMSDYSAKRLSQETQEQRNLRLARMSAYAAKRLASETPEQRRERLARMSAYSARRQAIKKLMKVSNPSQ